MTGSDRVIGVIWSICALALAVAMVAGAVQVIGDFSGEMVFRWIMALFFLGGTFAWVTAYFQDSLRRFFTR